MSKIESISLKDWLLIAPGTFLIGLSVGLAFSNFLFAPWIFLFGFLIEAPALIAIKKHKK